MRTEIILAILLITPTVGAVEISPGVNILQPDFGAQLEFTDNENFTRIGVYPPVSGLDYSNFSVNPEDTAELGLKFYRANASRQRFVTNFSADTNASTEEDVAFNLSDLPSDDFYEAFFSNNDTRIFIGYADPRDTFEFSTSIIESEISVFNYGEKGVATSNVSLNDSDPVEGEKIAIKYELTNEGVVDTESPLVALDIETWNGTRWIQQNSTSKVETVSPGQTVTESFVWSAEPGPYRFNITADPNDNIKETNETNNIASGTFGDDPEIFNVSSYQILYGKSDSEIVLGADNTTVYTWNPKQDVGLLFFADSDSNFGFSELEPVGDNKFDIVTDELEMNGHNDSIKKLWDPNGDGIADQVENYEIAGVSKSVPVANSTSSNNFTTGLLYDSDQGDPYDGSQDILMVTEIRPSTVGKYGTYDYEVRIPFSLGGQIPGTDSVSIYSRLK